MANNLKLEDKKLVKKAFSEVKSLWEKLCNDYGELVAKSAFNKKLNWEKEKTKLMRKKELLESQLSEIEQELK